MVWLVGVIEKLHGDTKEKVFEAALRLAPPGPMAATRAS